MTLNTALRNARYLSVLMRHSDKTELACRSNMANSFCGAIIETSQDGVLKRPSYYLKQLYARDAQPVPLRVDQAGDGPDKFAYGSADGESVVVFAVNSKTEPVVWPCEFEGFSAAVRRVKAEVLSDKRGARLPGVMNHWAAPERVKTTRLWLEPSQNQMILPALSVMAAEFEAT